MPLSASTEFIIFRQNVIRLVALHQMVTQSLWNPMRCSVGSQRERSPRNIISTALWLSKKKIMKITKMKCNCLTNTGSRTNVQITLRFKNKFLSRRLSVNSRLTRHTKRKNYRSCSRVYREASQAHRRHRLRHTSWFMSLRDLTKERNLCGASQSWKSTWTPKEIAQAFIKSVRGQTTWYRK